MMCLNKIWTKVVFILLYLEKLILKRILVEDIPSHVVKHLLVY